MDEEEQSKLDAWAVLWEIRELLLSIPPQVRRPVLDTAIQQANAVYGNEFEQEARAFLAPVLPED